MFKSLKSRLFIWYTVSLFLMTIFVVLVVHVLVLKNGTFFLALLFLTLAVFGFTVIYKITRSLTYLASKMKMISSKNLDDRIDDIQSDDELGELAYSFNELLDRLHNAFNREQQFIADVAHELKTPLATLRSTIEVLFFFITSSIFPFWEVYLIALSIIFKIALPSLSLNP